MFVNVDVKVNKYWGILDMRTSSCDYSSICARTPKDVDEHSVFSYSRRIHVCVVLA